MRGVQLRPYQVEAINALHDFLEQDKGNPIVSVPTGGGKSLITAGYVESALQKNPKERFLIAAHVKEIHVQNAEALESVLGRPVGTYCAGMNSYELDKNVTVASIQSIYNKPEGLEGIGRLIIDEAHRVCPDEDSMYSQHIHALRGYNPNLRIIGLTATPFRLKGGLLHTMENAVFDDIAYHVPLIDLIEDGYLCPLISKKSHIQANLKGIRKGWDGDFLKSAASRAMDIPSLINGALDELMDLAKERKSWLLFCAGVAHAKNVTKALRSRGIKADYIFGDTPHYARDALIEDFKSGKLQALVNADVLTTGFNAPNIDLIALLRPTMSPGLYIQMVGRGLRMHPGKDNCLVLDYAGNIERFGPVDQVETPLEYFNESKREFPKKMCPQCALILHASAKDCPNCDYHFQQKLPHEMVASELDILSIEDPEDAEALMLFPQLRGKRNKNKRKIALYIAKKCQENGGIYFINASKFDQELNISIQGIRYTCASLVKEGIIIRSRQRYGGYFYCLPDNKPAYFDILSLPKHSLEILSLIAQLSKPGHHNCSICNNGHIANFSLTKSSKYLSYSKSYFSNGLMTLKKRGYLIGHTSGKRPLFASYSIHEDVVHMAIEYAHHNKTVLPSHIIEELYRASRFIYNETIVKEHTHGASKEDLVQKYNISLQTLNWHLWKAKKRAQSSPTPESQQYTL